MLSLATWRSKKPSAPADPNIDGFRRDRRRGGLSFFARVIFRNVCFWPILLKKSAQ
jgi:hypothetical protein